ncbi:hypothetical protein FBZ98_1152 [Rhizobium sp. ERR 922]|nr:hypothetical protein FBZ98_1152 [Rhizobium sp. ERR 922]TWB88233.1 hypothetical protein FBZ97_11456 [Rhizobium sp. ERR 942]
MMSSAQPSNRQWLLVLIVMGVDSFDAADFASLSIDLTRLQGSLNRKMGFVFAGIGPSPVGLAGIRLQHVSLRLMRFADRQIARFYQLRPIAVYYSILRRLA